MGLSSVFQVFQLALGPSLPFTMGAFKTGQYFREVLIGIPFHQNNRILVEFLGDFSIHGKTNACDIALLSGLGGYIPGETRMELRRFHNVINKEGGFQLLAKTWPFNSETDIIFNSKRTDLPHHNTIRFHVLDEDANVITQAEYTVSGKGLVSGPGSRDNDPGSNIDQIDSFAEIIKICNEENIALIDYIYSSEELIHSIPKEQTLNRMLQTWRIMEASIENGLENTGDIANGIERRGHSLQVEYVNMLPLQDFLGKSTVEAGIFAICVSEESMDNQLVITAPVCETSGIVSGVLKALKKKFLFSENQMAEALLIGGFMGSILQKLSIRVSEKTKRRLDFPIATAMASAAGLYLFNKDLDALNNCIHMALKLADSDADYLPENLPLANLKHANLALTSINYGMINKEVANLPFDRYFYLESLRK